jgi:hypothetical protein
MVLVTKNRRRGMNYDVLSVYPEVIRSCISNLFTSDSAARIFSSCCRSRPNAV